MKKVQTTLKSYPEKILLAWAEAIKGNENIRSFLVQHGYEELGVFYFALRNDVKAKKWLLINKFPHLLALISGAEGSEKAVEWLEQHQFTTLAKVALAGDNDLEAFEWLKKNELLFARIALEISRVKNDIEDKNADPHRINI